MADQDAAQPEKWMQEMLLALLASQTNLVGVAAQMAHRHGVPIPTIHAAILKLIEMNEIGLPSERTKKIFRDQLGMFLEMYDPRRGA